MGLFKEVKKPVIKGASAGNGGISPLRPRYVERTAPCADRCPHGQEIRDGSALGAVKFDSDTALYFRREILRPFLDQYLKEGAPRADIPPVVAFETGTNMWRRLPAWPIAVDARLL